MRQKAPYGVFGFLCGMAVAVLIATPILQVIINNQQLSIPPFYRVLMVLVFGIIGVFAGLKFDAHINGGEQGGIVPKIINVSIKYFGFLSYASRRLEGNYVVYEVLPVRNFFMILCLILAVFFIGKYFAQPLAEVLNFSILIACLIGGLPMANDSIRAISKKVVTNAAGKKELWFEVTKNITE